MSVTGVVTNVSPERAGDTLSVDTLATDTVLLLDDAGDFDELFEVPRFLVLGAETDPRQYTAVANDEDEQQSVTLASPVGAVFEAGTPVTLWDPDSEAADGRAVTYQAWVRLDGGVKPIPVTIPYGTVPVGKEYTLKGASVGIDEDEEGDWYISHTYGREPVLDQSVLAFPLISVDLASSQDVPVGSATVVTGWTGAPGTKGEGAAVGGWYKNKWLAYVPRDIISGGGTDGIDLDEPGAYLHIVTIDWAPNTSGGRTVWLVIDRDGVEVDRVRVNNPPSPLGFCTQQLQRLFVSQGNETCRIEVDQTSGATLAVSAGLTNWQIGRLSK